MDYLSQCQGQERLKFMSLYQALSSSEVKDLSQCPTQVVNMVIPSIEVNVVYQ